MIEVNTRIIFGTNQDLIELIKSRKIKPIIDKQFSLSDVPKALRYVRDGKAKGKVVIIVKNDSK